jgi:predicted MFS family arabinose efflux permease
MPRGLMQVPAIPGDAQRAPSAVWLTLAGLCASLVGIGLARFAYTPLLPAIVQAHWFDAADAAYLGAANLVGYLAGALLAAPLAARLRAAVILRLMMLAVVASLVACAWPVNFLWILSWRALSGFAGGVLIVLSAPTILPWISEPRRGIASGVIFMGVGLGIVLSGTLVPLLLRQGLMQAWLGLGLLSLVLALIAWHNWPAGEVSVAIQEDAAPPSALPLRMLYVVYGLCAFGLVPHMVFFVDFIARGLDLGVDVGANYWVVVGIGAIAGPLLIGYCADRSGYGIALRLSLLVTAVAIALPALFHTTAALVVSGFLAGALMPGCVILALGRIRELLPNQPDRQKSAWGLATTSFALCQAIAAYGYSYLFDHTGADYALLFALGGGALLVALVVEFLVPHK